MMAKQQARRHLYGRSPSGWRGLVRRLRGAMVRLWSWFLRQSIGYGYAPWRALPWFAASWGLAFLVFAQTKSADMTPAPNAQEEFHPAIYALDLLLPVVNLRQRDNWTPHHGYVWWALAFTIAGWLIATVIIAGLADLFKHD